MPLLDLARFAPADPEPIVAAAFACPYCLRDPTFGMLAEDVVHCACGPCEAVGALPSYDVSDQNIAVRFAESAFYEYPKGFIGGWGKGMRIFSPDALLGSTFKLKEKDSGYWAGWHGLGTVEIRPTLEH